MTEIIVTEEQQKFLDQATADIVDFSVGFVLSNKSGTDEQLAGSGTLAVINGQHAILTASHVLTNLPDSGMIGLVLPTRFQPTLHRPILDMRLTQKICFGKKPFNAEGPDLGILQIPDPLAGTIKTSKTFYNLTRPDRLTSNYKSTEFGVWFVSGFADEWTDEQDPEFGYQRVKVFKGICGAGDIVEERTDNEFDYLDFLVKYDTDYEGPHSFEGYSGGGLWHFDVVQDQAGKLQIQNKILSGIIFYQSALENYERLITCHGRKSVYEICLKSIPS